MLKIFEKSTILQVIVILAVTALLWGKAFVDPQPMMPSDHYAPLYDLFYNLSPSPILATTIALVLVLLGGFFFNLMLSSAGLSSQNSLLPTLLFIVAISATSPRLSPSLLAALTVVAIVRQLMLHSTLLTVAADKIFSTAALIGIASMLYLPSLSLIVAYLLIAINYRLYGWRDWMMLLLGLLAPYLLLWIVQFFADTLLDGFAAMGAEFSSTALIVGELTTLQLLANIVLLTVFVVSLLVVWSHLGEKTIVWQKNAATIMFITVATLAMLPFSQLFPVNLQFLAVPFAFCLSQRFGMSSRHRSLSSRPSWHHYLYDALFILIILAAIAC